MFTKNLAWTKQGKKREQKKQEMFNTRMDWSMGREKRLMKTENELV